MRASRVKGDGDRANGSCATNGYISPKRQDEVKRRDFKWDEQSFIKEEIPSRRETESFVNPLSSQSNEPTRDWRLQDVGRHRTGACENVIEVRDNCSILEDALSECLS